jgi:hypothetical protein
MEKFVLPAAVGEVEMENPRVSTNSPTIDASVPYSICYSYLTTKTSIVENHVLDPRPRWQQSS